jgi:hypothetical protein
MTRRSLNKYFAKDKKDQRPLPGTVFGQVTDKLDRTFTVYRKQAMPRGKVYNPNSNYFRQVNEEAINE